MRGLSIFWLGVITGLLALEVVAYFDNLEAAIEDAISDGVRLDARVAALEKGEVLGAPTDMGEPARVD